MHCSYLFTVFLYVNLLGEIKNQVEDSKSKLLFAVKENLHTAQQVARECASVKAIVLVGSSGLGVPTLEDVSNNNTSSTKIIAIEELLNRIPRGDDIEIPIELKRPVEDATAFILYSSGSTGKPKGVRRTHKNFLASFSKAPIETFMGVSGEITTCHQPMPHASGSWTGMGAMNMGQKTIVSRAFSLENWLRVVQEYGVTMSYLAPSYIVSVTKNPKTVARYNLDSLKVVFTGGAPLPDSVIDIFVEMTNIENLKQGYGSTEAGGVSVTPTDVFNPRSVGHLTCNYTMRIVNRGSGQNLGPLEIGEFYVKGPEVSPGYLNNPDADIENFTKDGWCKTGDAGYIDSKGLLFIVDRYKEVIKVDTQQVPPAELESILLTHDSIKEAAVIGIPDEDHGEVPKAFVVTNDSSYNQESVLEFVNSQVAEWKKLRGGIQVIDHLPKISLGKIDRVFLKNLQRRAN